VSAPGPGTVSLALDATRYLTEINRVSQATQSLNATMQSLNGTLQQFSIASGQASSASTHFAGGLGTLNQQLGVLSGIAAAQSVLRLSQSFAAATQEAAAFSRSIGLISTITQGSGLSYQQWADGVKSVSDALGSPLLETSAAAYDLLSNQISSAADTFQTLTTAGQLAQVTNASVTDSVNALSNAINAYGYSAGSAEELSAKFFATVDLGRVKLSEVANTSGRVYETGKALGVSFDEINAALIAITQTGVKTSTSMTLIVNVLQKLLKPTAELQELYDKLGVGTGDVLVKTYGFMGALQKLQEATKGSVTEVAKFFNEIRGKQGFDILIDQQEAYNRGLREQIDGTNRFKAALETYNTPGFKLQQELQQTSNALTVGLKTGLMEGVLEITQAFGGLKNTMLGALQIAGAIGGGIAGWNVALAASQVTAAGLVATLSGAAVPATVAVVTAALGQQLVIYQQMREEARNVYGMVLDAQLELARAEQASSDKVTAHSLENTKKELEAKVKAQLEFQNSARQSLGKIGDSLDALADKTQAKLKNAVELILGSARDALRDLDSRLSKSVNNVQAAQRSREGLRGERDDALYTYRVAADRANTGGAREGIIAQERLDQLRRQMDAAVKAGNKDEYDKLHGKASGILNDLATATNPDGSLKYHGQEDAIRQFYAQADKDFAQIKAVSQRNADALTKQKAELSSQVKALEDAGRDLYTYDVVDKRGEPLFANRDEAQAEAQKRIAAFRSNLDVVRANPNAADNFRGVANEQLLAERTKSLNQAIAEHFGVRGQQQQELSAVGRINTAGNQIAATLESITKKLAASAADMTAAETRYGEVRSKSRATLGSILAEGAETGTFFPPGSAQQSGYEHLQKRVTAINEAADRGDFKAARGGADQLEQFLRNAGVYATEAMQSGPYKTPKGALNAYRQLLGQQEEAFGEQFRSRRQYGQLDQSVPDTVERLNAALSGLNQAAKTTDLSKLTSAADAYQALVDRIGQSVQAIEAMGRGERAVRELPAANQSHGGFAGYFAQGGEPRGVDSINAMLAPGEYVVNAQSAARFHSQLVAMNAGVSPFSPVASEPGHTFNGGINVTVQGGNTSEQTIKEIGAGLRRQIRLGTLKL